MIYILRRAMELVNCLSCCRYSCLCHIYPLYIYLATYVWEKPSEANQLANHGAATGIPGRHLVVQGAGSGAWNGDRIGVKPWLQGGYIYRKPWENVDLMGFITDL